MTKIRIIISVVLLSFTNMVCASLIVQVGPNGYYQESALSKFRDVDFEIKQLDYSTSGGWWAAGDRTLMNYNSSTVFSFDTNIIDITSYNDRFIAAVLDTGDFYLVGPNGYINNTSLSQLRDTTFDVKMLDYSETGGWWAAGDYSIINYQNNTSHTFTQKIVDIASYNDDFLVVTLEDGKLWVAGPNGFESDRSFSKFQGLDFGLTEVDFSSAGSWWAAGNNKIINYGSGTSRDFDYNIIDITSFNRDYAVVLIDDSAPPPRLSSTSSISVTEPPLMALLASFLAIAVFTVRRRLKALK